MPNPLIESSPGSLPFFRTNSDLIECVKMITEINIIRCEACPRNPLPKGSVFVNRTLGPDRTFESSESRRVEARNLAATGNPIWVEVRVRRHSNGSLRG